MKISMSIKGATLSWETSDQEALVSKVLNPSLAERINKSVKIIPASAESLHKYILSKGFDVDFVHEDLIAEAKLTFWKHALVNGPAPVTKELFSAFVREVGLPLRTIQEEALFRIINSGFSVNASICGSGKTLTTLMNSLYFHKNYGRCLTIIAAPAACMSEYKKEIQNYRGYFEDLSMEEISGDSTAEMMEKILNSTSDILVVSLNSLEKLVQTIQDKIAGFAGEVIFVVEEAHYIKEVTSGRSLGAQQIAPLANRVIVNTATPMPKGPADIRGILSLVGIPLPSESYAEGIPTKDFETLKGVTFVSDEVDIPYGPVQTQHLEYRDLHELTEKMYDVVKNELNAGNKVVVFCTTNKGLEEVWNSFPSVNKTVLSGSFFVNDCSEKDLNRGRNYEMQQNAIAQFNHDPRCMLLVANYRVGSTGVNLQHSGARLAFFYEISNNGADFFQARYRIRRPYTFPKDGFLYCFARNSDSKKRKTEDRQFAKLANQQSILNDIKRLTRGVS